MPPKRRRRFQGLYYHSSPPKVLPMNGQLPNENSRRRRETDDFSVKLSTIRIWMHEKDIGKLTRILWAGQGNRLRQQASTNGKVKRFLAAVPYVMNSIRDVHQAVIDNSLETLQAKLEAPVPPSLVTCRDANGLNLIHKAAGLGHATILEYLIATWPDGVHDCDITGKTPLHWAASAKNNMRCYTLLTQAGCDEEAVDYKMKTPSFYRHKPHEIERAFLLYVPEAPRVSPDIATDWEALSEDTSDGRKLDIKIPEMNGFGRHSNTESNENTSEAEMTEGASAADDEDAGGGETEAEAEVEPEPEPEPEPELEPEPENEPEAEPEPESTNETEENNSEEQEEESEQTAETEKHKDDNDNDDAKVDEEGEAVTETETKNEDENEEQPAQEDEVEPQDEKQTQSVNELGTEATGDDKEDEDQKPQDHDQNNENGNESHNVETSERENEKASNKSNDEALESSAEDKQEQEVTDKQNEKDVHVELNNDKDVHEQKNNDNVAHEEKDNANVAHEEKDNDNVAHEEKDNKDAQENNDNIERETKDTKDNKNEVHEVIEEEKDKEENIKEKQSLPEQEMKTEITNLEESEDIKVNGEQEKEKEMKVEETMDKKHKNEVLVENADKGDSAEHENHVKESEVVQDKKLQSENGTHEEKGKTEDTTEHKEIDKKDKETKDITEKVTEEQGSGKIAENVTEEQGNGKIAPEQVTKETKKDDVVPKPAQEAQEALMTKIEENVSKESADVHAAKIEEDNKNVSPIKAKFEATAPDLVSLSPDKKLLAKTADDEINNNSPTKSVGGGSDADDAAVDVRQKKLSDIKEDSQENGNSFLHDVQQDLSDKFEEISENLKDNVQHISDKIKNVFSSSDEKDKSADVTNGNDKHEVIVRSASPPKSAAKSPKPASGKVKKRNGLKNVDSSDDTNEEDEDEDAEAPAEEAANEEESVENNEMPGEGTPEVEAANGQSPTPSLAIEGFVQGEAEDNTVQSQTAAYVDDDDDDNEETRLSRAIASGDMEQLAQIVLNGDGKKLLDVKSTEPEIQAFLRNVPNYMDKIHRVHEAARSGSLLNLQQALDRRKFAVAKDEISPNGTTPLHVAVLFGHSDIVRYLAARFPETTSIADKDGRTALHYAAVINDNGHFYNVLLQLGANPKALDKMGYTPEQYMEDEKLREDFNYRSLLKNFGAEDLEAKLLSDQGQVENHSFQENPIFKTEQGKYLADNLADPLIKALTQVAHKRPQDPLQYLTNYLQNFAAARNINGKTLVQAAVHSGSSHTNSTALANSNPSPTPAQMRHYQPISQMNGHVKYDNTNDIDDESFQNMVDNDEGDDSDAALSKRLEERDEHGQSMLHFASARSHRRGGLLHLIEESKADITYRDELYRTARDVALQANQVGNAKEIDRYMLSLAVVGDVKPFEHFALSGYDHIIDIMDDNEISILELVESKGHTELAEYLKSVRPMEELREELHQMIRDLKVERVKEIVDSEDGKMLIMAKNYYGRTALHIAILKESEEIIEHFVNICPEALKVGDNLERTPLHYAMGTNIVEGISRVLIQNGAKRTNKDLKGRQPSYYFMNKADILRLQEEEDESR